MKKHILLPFALILFISYGFAPNTSALAAKRVNLTLNYSFTGIEEGYDHENKTEIYIDGILAGTSSIKKESEPNSMTVSTKKGTHEIKIVNYAFYGDVWEAHTIENSYSHDLIYITSMDLKKKNTTIELLFDLDNGVVLK